MNSNIHGNFFVQFKALFPVAIKVWSFISLMYILVLGVGFTTGVPLGSLTRDPMATMEAPFYTGFLSNIGVLFWTSAAAICYLGYSILLKQHVNSPIKPFLFYSSLITTLLLLDDFFMIHEVVFPTYLKIPEKVYLLCLGAGILIHFYRFRNFILKTEYLILLCACCFLAISEGVDLLPFFKGQFAIEDGFKLLGISTWLLYFFRLTRDTLSIRRKQSIKIGKVTLAEGLGSGENITVAH